MIYNINMYLVLMLVREIRFFYIFKKGKRGRMSKFNIRITLRFPEICNKHINYIYFRK